MVLYLYLYLRWIYYERIIKRCTHRRLNKYRTNWCSWVWTSVVMLPSACSLKTWVEMSDIKELKRNSFSFSSAANIPWSKKRRIYKFLMQRSNSCRSKKHRNTSLIQTVASLSITGSWYKQIHKKNSRPLLYLFIEVHISFSDEMAGRNLRQLLIETQRRRPCFLVRCRSGV